MRDKIVKAVGISGIFALVSIFAVSLLMSTLLYFEILEVDIISKILYGAFVVILLITSFLAARTIGSRGLLIGFVITGILVVLSAMYRLIGIETGLDLAFLIKGAIILLVACIGSVVGVNSSRK